MSRGIDADAPSPCVSPGETVAMEKMFHSALYEHGLLLVRDVSHQVATSFSVDTRGATVGSFAYTVPTRNVFLALPTLRFAHMFPVMFERAAVYNLSLREVSSSDQFLGRSTQSLWLVFRYTIAKGPTDASAFYDVASRATRNASRKSTFRNSTYQSAVVVSVADPEQTSVDPPLVSSRGARACVPPGVPPVSSRRWFRPWFGVPNMLSRCRRLFRGSAPAESAPLTSIAHDEDESHAAPSDAVMSPPVVSMEMNVIPRGKMSVLDYVRASIADATENMEAALGTTLIGNGRAIYREVTMAALADMCIAMDAVCSVRGIRTAPETHCVVYGAQTPTPCVHVYVPASMSWTDLYLHGFRQIHDSILSVEVVLMDDIVCDDVLSVYVFLHRPCHSYASSADFVASSGESAPSGSPYRRVTVSPNKSPHAMTPEYERPTPSKRLSAFASDSSALGTAASLVYDPSVRGYISAPPRRAYDSMSPMDRLTSVDATFSDAGVESHRPMVLSELGLP